MMKHVLASFTAGLLLLLSVNALAWTKVVDCNHDETVVDRQEDIDGNTGYQIVFRNQKTLSQLLESGSVATSRLTSLSEIVLNLTPKANGWIGEEDANRDLGVVYYVHAESTQLQFEAFQTAYSPTGKYSVLEKLGSWTLNNCVAK